MAFDKHGVLYVSSRALDSVLKFRTTDGMLLGEISLANEYLGPHGLVFGPDGGLFVSCNERIVKFDPESGEFLGTFVTGLEHATGMVFDAHGDLFVAWASSNTIRRYDAKSGVLLDAWSAKDGRLSGPIGLAMMADGSLLVACATSDRIERYEPSTGDFRGVFASGGGLKGPIYMAFGPEGDLYVAGGGSHAIHRFDGPTGNPKDIVAKLIGPEGVAFSHEGDLYTNSIGNDGIVRIDVDTRVTHSVLPAHVP
jgi:streptogramin lyase